MVTPREVTLWREHLAVTVVRTLADGRQQLLASATVNNHLAHLSALFTWVAAHADDLTATLLPPNPGLRERNIQNLPQQKRGDQPHDGGRNDGEFG